MRKRIIAGALAIAVATLLSQAAAADASYPGAPGSIVYELNGSWAAGNLGSCDDCSGTLSGLYRLDTSLEVGSIDDCLYPAGMTQTICGGGTVVTECNSDLPSSSTQSAGPNCAVLHPSSSADGTRLVYAATATTLCAPGGCGPPAASAPTRLTISAADGSGPTTLPQLTSSDSQPAFLPSGNELVFTGHTGSGRAATTNLYEVATDGTGLTRLTSAGASQPAPCTNGAIAYVHAGDIYVRNQSGRSIRLTRTGGQRPDCAPSSTSIAFAKGSNIYTVALGGRHRIARVPLSSPTVVSGPVYSPDGRELAFTIDRRTPHFNWDACYPGRVADTYYLEIVTLAGKRLGRAHQVSDSGIDDSDCGGHRVIPGGIAWAPTAR